MKIFKNKLRKWLNTYGIYVVLGGIAVYTLLFSLISIWKYNIFAYNGFDLAYFSQVFWNTLQGDFFAQSIHPHLSLGDHAGLLIPILTPLYAIFPDPRTLLVMQTIALALPAWPIYLIAKRRLGSLSSVNLRAVLPIFFSLAWLMNPAVQNSNLFEFHLLPFALVPLFFAMHAYDKEKKKLFLLMLAIALLVREDVAMVVFMMGILAWWEKKPMWWRVVPAMIGAGWFIFTMKLIGHFSIDSGYKFLVYYSWLGDSVQSIIFRALVRPDIVLNHILSVPNLEMVIGIVLPLLFLPFFAPKRLILAFLPFLQIILSAAGGGELVIQTHYSTLFMTGVFLAAIEAARNFEHVEKLVPLPKPQDRRQLLMLLLVVTTGYAMLILGPARGIIKRVAHSELHSARVAAANNLISNIPHGAEVAASYSLMPHLANRTGLYAAHYHFLGRTQFDVESYELPETTDFIAFDGRDLLFYSAQFPKTGWTAPYHDSGFGRLLDVIDAEIFTEQGMSLYSYEKQSPVSVPSPTGAGFPSASIEGEFHEHASTYRLYITWSSPIPMSTNAMMSLVFRNDTTQSEEVIHEIALPNTITSDMNTTSTIVTIPKLTPSSYTPIVRIQKQDAEIQLDGIRSTTRAIISTDILQEIYLQAILLK